MDDLDEATVAELPPGHEDYSQGALIFPLYRIIAYHTVQQVRYKFADLMSVLSTTYKQWTSLHPGEGVLMCSLTEERVALRPFPLLALPC